MDDLRRLLLLRALVVLGPGIMLLWLRFGLTPPQPLPLLAVALLSRNQPLYRRYANVSKITPTTISGSDNTWPMVSQPNAR